MYVDCIDYIIVLAVYPFHEQDKGSKYLHTVCASWIPVPEYDEWYSVYKSHVLSNIRF